MITEKPRPSPETSTNSSRRIWAVLTGIVLLAVGVVLGFGFRPYVYAGTVLQSSEPAPSMAHLVYDDGSPVDLVSSQDKVVLVYFGYTNCPDLCPTMLSEIDGAVDSLGDDATRVETIMVTVDPERDQPESLGRYVRTFNEDFRGVWGERTSVFGVATRYGVHFEADDSGEDYLIAHTSTLLAIDPEGVLRLAYPAGVTSEELATDIEALLG